MFEIYKNELVEWNNIHNLTAITDDEGIMVKHFLDSVLPYKEIEDGATVTSPLVPWSTCGMTHSTILGVSTFAYFPYCFFCYLSPIISILIATLGYKVFRRDENGEFVPVNKTQKMIN